MSVEIVGIITLAFAILGMSRDPSFLIYCFFCASLLGSAAAFILTSLGGTNIAPAHLLLGFLGARLLLDKEASRYMAESIQVGSPGFWLLITVGYAAFTAYFMPVLFAGQTFIFPIRVIGSNAYTNPLAPSMANLTQSIYLIGDFVCFVLISGYARTEGGFRTLSRAAIAVIVLNLVFAVLDLATYASGTSELLSFIRNANYSLLSDTELAGFKRIVGSFVEASSFGAATVGYFAFTSRLWLLGIRPMLTGVLSALSLLALLFSTSTTAYAGLALFAALCYVQCCIHGVQRGMTRQMVFFVVGCPLLLLFFGLVIALNDAASAYVQNIAETMVLSKMSSQSGSERSSWNSQALKVFFDTSGFGAGNGSLRASSFPVAVLACLGFIGGILFAIYLALVVFGRPKGVTRGTSDWAYREGARSVCIAGLITSTVSGALTDLGLPFFAFAAIATSLPRKERHMDMQAIEPQRLSAPPYAMRSSA